MYYSDPFGSAADCKAVINVTYSRLCIWSAEQSSTGAENRGDTFTVT